MRASSLMRANTSRLTRRQWTSRRSMGSIISYPPRISTSPAGRFTTVLLLPSSSTTPWTPITSTRLLSSNKPSPSPNIQLSELLEQLDNAPIKSLSLDQFQKAADLILLVSNSNNHHDNIDDTAVMIDHSFQILERLVQEVQANIHDKQYVAITQDILTTELLYHLINEWKAVWKQGHVSRWTSRRVWTTIKSWSRTKAPGHLEPSIEIYNLILESYWDVKGHDDPIAAAHFVYKFYTELITKTGLIPNQKTYELVLPAWIQAKQVPWVLDLLASIREEHAKDKNTTAKLRFGPAIFETALQACVHARSGPWADIMLDHMHYYHEQGLLSEQPHIGHYTQVIQAWAATKKNRNDNNHREDNAARQRMAELSEFVMEHPTLKPDILTYNAILKGVCEWGDMKDAEHILKQLCSLYRQDPAHAVKPDVQCFGTVLDGWSRATKDDHNMDAGHKAETLLRLMWDSHQMVPIFQHLVPDVECYNAVMLAYITAGDVDATAQAERLFQEMQQKATNEEGYSHLQPTSKTYGTLIHGWAQHGQVDQAANILSFALDAYQTGTSTAIPDTQCFNSLLNAYAQSKDIIAGIEANRLLDKMWELHSNDRFEAASSVRPNEITYNSAINAWAQSGHADAGEEAERLLREMMTKAKELDDETLLPSTITYNSVIHAWGKCGNYDRANTIFRELPSTAPSSSSSSFRMLQRQQQTRNDNNDGDRHQVFRNVGTYNSLLSALAHAENKLHDENFHKGEIADSILTAMKVRGIQPDIKTYGLAHKCWFRPCHGDYDYDKANLRLSVLKDQIDGLENQRHHKKQYIKQY